MARPSKLTDKQWEEIKSRMLHGEKAADLSREYKVSKASISERVSERLVGRGQWRLRLQRTGHDPVHRRLRSDAFELRGGDSL